MLRSLVTLTGLTDLLGIYHEVMEPAYAQTIKKVNRLYPDLQSLNDMDISHSQALNIVFAWLERVAAADPGLFKTIITQTYIGKTQDLIRQKSPDARDKKTEKDVDIKSKRQDNKEKEK